MMKVDFVRKEHYQDLQKQILKLNNERTRLNQQLDASKKVNSGLETKIGQMEADIQFMLEIGRLDPSEKPLILKLKEHYQESSKK